MNSSYAHRHTIVCAVLIACVAAASSRSAGAQPTTPTPTVENPSTPSAQSEAARAETLDSTSNGPPAVPTGPSSSPTPSDGAKNDTSDREAKPSLKVTPLGYVEAHYAYNFNRPSNGITNFRGFDNRHNTFTLANAALGANAEYGSVSARLILQVGATPSTYYAGDPTLPGAGGANASGPEVWKYIQEANVSWKAPVRRGLLLQLGLFPSPIGPEVFAVKDNWNYSRSNLFFGFPFYHTGLRATYEWTDELSTTLSVFNGWNAVVDNNEEKSIQTNITYKVPSRILVQALYFGGVERPSASRPEGPYWRHDFDLFAQYDATTWLSVMAHGNHGWEPNRIGTARWTAGALYARVKPIERAYVALRGDRFHEHLATDNAGRSSSPIFWSGVEWVSSATATLDVRPAEQLSIRAEYRHDVADTPLYFGRNVQGNGSAGTPYLPNTRTQDTVLLGATAWF